jgi:hypothetical protein
VIISLVGECVAKSFLYSCVQVYRSFLFLCVQVELDYDLGGLDYPSYTAPNQGEYMAPNQREYTAPNQAGELATGGWLGQEQETEQEQGQEQEQEPEQEQEQGKGQELEQGQGPQYENFLIADAIQNPAPEVSAPLEIGQTGPSTEPEIR